ncbi:uncharacterized protein LOC143838856 [Paroedura picta]|uniref:uncharacterized protein LOC143838856 n=1 Tax=Paroedura picta TaxID=143630 RepID=UPI00405699F2
MLAQIQERYRIVMLERQKRMKEGQQLLERLRETDLLIDQLWQEPAMPSFAEDPAEPTLDENYGIPSSSEENPGPSSQPVDIQKQQRIEKLERRKRMKEGRQLLKRLRETDLLIDQLWQESEMPSSAENERTPDPAEPTLDENYGTPSSLEDTAGPSSQHVDIDQLWQEPEMPRSAGNETTPDPAEPTLEENYGTPSEEDPGPSSQHVDVGDTSKDPPFHTSRSSEIIMFL